LPGTLLAIERHSCPVRAGTSRDIGAVTTRPRPPGVTKIADTDFWRLRVGDMRIVHTVVDHIVVVLKVARRSESTYRRTP
jgi:mRNA-degrading endonuclease RelE of RelBE toxin-antitoxin system